MQIITSSSCDLIKHFPEGLLPFPSFVINIMMAPKLCLRAMLETWGLPFNLPLHNLVPLKNVHICSWPSYLPYDLLS